MKIKLNKNDWKLFLKNFNWKLFLIIALTILIPAIYQTVRIYFIGDINDGSSYTIASQIQWLNIAYEIITEAIIVPMFFWLSKIKDKMDEEKNVSEQIKGSFTSLTLIVFGLFLLFSIIIFACLNPILDNANLDSITRSKSLEYMMYQVWAIFLTNFASYLIVSFSILRLPGYLWMGIIVNALYLISNTMLDLFIVSDNSFSLKLEYKGLGISSIVSSVLFLLASIIYFLLPSSAMFTYKLDNCFLFNKSNIILYFKNFLLAGAETLIRNVVFSYMIIKMMALVGEQGTYWVANSFIWTWMLMPITMLSLFIKETYASQVIFDDPIKDRNYKMTFYYGLTLVFILIWAITIPAYKPFIHTIMNVDDASSVYKIIMLLFAFYICYALSSPLDAWFIAEGRIGIFLLQTIIVNLIFYPIYYICYKTGAWIPSLESIALMFGFGLLVDFIVDVILYWIVIKYDKFIKYKIQQFKNKFIPSSRKNDFNIKR